jgi:hypothetical protein
VAVLFLADDRPCWGRAEPVDEFEVHDDQQEPGDEDLFELAALATLAAGGDVYLDDANVVPEGTRVAALVR